MTDRINGVPMSGIVEFLDSGIKESQRVAIRNSLVDDEGHEDKLSGFANRMTVRLNTAIKRIEELEVAEAQLLLARKRIAEMEAQSVRDSWAGEVDRMGGSFSAEEIARSRGNTW
jgi:predicted trehalose synthase